MMSAEKPHLNKVAPWTEVVGRCKKCGREFVYVNPDKKPPIDPYPPLGTRPRDAANTPECGGEIEMLID